MNGARSSLSYHLPTLASIAVGIVPLVILIHWFEVPRKLILGWGILSFLVGVTLLKLPLYHLLVVRVLHPRLSHFWLGVIQGVLSASAELGSAFVFFLYVVPGLTLPQLIGFGAAAGAVEAVVLPFMGNPLEGTPLERHSADIAQRAARPVLLQWMGVLERALAMNTHVASRGLVYVSASTGNPLPGVFALITFAALDGRAYSWHLQEKAWDNPQVLVRFYFFFALIGILQMSTFLLFTLVP